jgi:hypothetical protein
MLFRLGWVFALTCLFVTTNRQELASECCQPESEKLSSRRVKNLLQNTEPIRSPCCADMLHIKGTVVLALAIDNNGEVVCVQSVSGHPLVISTTIESVRRWKFRPYVLRGLRKSFCGRIAIRFVANEHVARYKVVDAP